MPNKKVLVKDVYEALKQDGFEHLRSKWHAEDVNGVITGGCVLQQTAMNLGVEANLMDESGENDHRYSLIRQLNKFKVHSSSRWSKNQFEIPFDNMQRGLGNIIIYWNDAETGDGYYLPTYKEVADMAYEVMEPFFDKEVTLKTRDWTFKRLELVPA